MIWKISVLEFKRAQRFHSFAKELEQSCNDKNNSDTVHDCPICGREVSSVRFAPHLSKCLGLGGRSQNIKKGEPDTFSKGNHHPHPEFSTTSRIRQGASLKRRGRPPKKPQAVVTLTQAENEALLSNAISNATQRLHLQGLLTSSNLPTIKSAPSAPHPLSQSTIPNQPTTKLKRKKKKGDAVRHRSRNSSQASSSSDSEEEVEVEDESDDDAPVKQEEEEEAVKQLTAYQRSCTPGGPSDDQRGSIEQRWASENPSISPASIVPSNQVKQTNLSRPVLKRKSSSQADSTDGSDSD